MSTHALKQAAREGEEEAGRGRAIWCVAWIDSCACGRWGHTQVTALLSRLGSARDWAYGGAHMPSRALRSDIRPGPCCDPPSAQAPPAGRREVVFYSFISPAAPGGIWGAYRCGAEPMGANLAAVRECGVLVPRGVHRIGSGEQCPRCKDYYPDFSKSFTPPEAMSELFYFCGPPFPQNSHRASPAVMLGG